MRRRGAVIHSIVLGLILSAGMGAAWPLCPTEDSTWCVWVGSQQGNGQGSTVLNFGQGQWLTLP